MKNYLINLDKDAQRLAMQKKQFAEAGMRFERVRACETGEKDAFRWWCAVLRPTVKGELGCAASHCKCYRRILAEGERAGAIFEDDVVFANGIAEALRIAEEQCLRDPQSVVLLSDHRGGSKAGSMGEGERKLLSTDGDDCAEGYVIGREAARILAEKQRRIRVPSDWWRYFVRKGWIRLYRIEPAIVGQRCDSFASNIEERYVAKEHNFANRVWWRIRRAIGVGIDAILDGRKGW